MKFFASLGLVVFLTCESFAQADFAGDFHLPKSCSHCRYKVGGISGLHFDRETKKLYAASDDSKGPPRFYELDFAVKPRPRFSVAKEVLLKNADGTPYPGFNLDPEALIRTRDGRIWLASEGSVFKGFSTGVYLFASDGKFLKEFPSPAAFLKKSTRGTPNNKGFEALSVSSDERRLFAGTESPLRQDSATIEGKSVVRLVEWALDTKNSALSESAQYAYPLEKTPDHHAKDDLSQANSLVEMVHLEGKRFLTLERAWTPPQNVTSRVFNVDCGPAADIKAREELKKNDFTACKKSPLVQVNDFGSRLKPHIDNLEAMAVVEDGGAEFLVLASDDNFSDSQINQFLVFSLNRSKIDGRKSHGK